MRVSRLQRGGNAGRQDKQCATFVNRILAEQSITSLILCHGDKRREGEINGLRADGFTSVLPSLKNGEESEVKASNLLGLVADCLRRRLFGAGAFFFFSSRLNRLRNLSESIIVTLHG